MAARLSSDGLTATGSRVRERSDGSIQLQLFLAIGMAASMLVAGLPGVAQAQEDSSGGTAGSGSTVLKTGVHAAAVLQPSLTVIPASSTKPLSSSVQQYAAGGTYRPGQPAPIPPPPPPKPKPAPPAAAAAPAAPAAPKPPAKPAPPPKWDYTATPHNGIMTWEPGHDVEVKPPPGPSPLQKRLDNYLDNMAKQRKNARERAAQARRYSAPQAVRPMVAAPLLLPQAQLSRAVAKASTWQEWYERVSRTIYDQWQRASVGPGNAKVHITVWRTHDVDCQVSDFTPASDVARNANAEAAFREAAINSIYSLRKCEILDFPYSSKRDKISFDMDFKRGVNQKPGCQIGAVQDMENLPRTR